MLSRRLFYLLNIVSPKLKLFPIYVGIRFSGDHKRSVPPVPIPNTAVKALAADGSETIGLVRVGCCQIYDPDIPKGCPGLFLYPVTVSSSGKFVAKRKINGKD